MMGTLIVLVVLVATATASFELEVVTDVRRIVDLGVFAFRQGGGASVRVEHLLVVDDSTPGGGENETAAPMIIEPFGFVFDAVKSAQAAREEKAQSKADGITKHSCFVEDPKFRPADPSMRKNISLDIVVKEKADSTFLVSIDKPGLYAFFFYNCHGLRTKPPTITAATFTVHVEMWNYDKLGNKIFLMVGQEDLPTVYLLYTLVFSGLAFGWFKILAGAPAGEVFRVHYMMGFLVAVKALSLLFETAKFYHYSSTGHGSVWDVFYFITLTLKGMALFTVLLLLGSGWSVLKSFLSDQDKKILLILLPCQVLINISLAVLEESSEGLASYGLWSDLLQLLDVICCCAILLPIVWSIKNLRDAAGQDGKAAQAVAQMKTFRSFYILTVAYIYLTRIVIVMLENSLSYEHTYLVRSVREGVAVVFYAYSGYKFQPRASFSAVARSDPSEMTRRSEVSNV